MTRQMKLRGGLAGMGGVPEAQIMRNADGRFTVGGKDYRSSIFYTYVFDWNGETFAAGSNNVESLTFQNDADFVIQMVQLSAKLSADQTDAIAGTPLARIGLPNSDNNELPTLDQVRLFISDTDVPLMNKPVSAAHITGDGSDPFVPLHFPVIGRGKALQITGYNDSSVGLDMTLSLIGAKLYE
ncbi:MAG: hypothetical protein AAGJ54_05820 [Planctomycetota bacterium]